MFDPKIDITPMVGTPPCLLVSLASNFIISTLQVVVNKLVEVVSGKATMYVELKRMLRDLRELYEVAEAKKMNIALLTKINLSIIDTMFETEGSEESTRWKNVEK